MKDMDTIALEIARRFAPADQPQWLAELQVAIIAAMQSQLLEIFTVAGGDVECSPRPSLQAVVECVESMRSEYEAGEVQGDALQLANQWGHVFNGDGHDTAGANKNTLRRFVQAIDALAARQPVRIYGCCAQREGELHTAECPNMRHLAARQPVGDEWRDLAMQVERALGCRDGQRDKELDALLESAMQLLNNSQPGAQVPTNWYPIDQAPKDNKRPLFIAQFDAEGKLVEMDWDAIWEAESESWELPQVYYVWMSANGRVEEPTHFAYMDSPAQGIDLGLLQDAARWRWVRKHREVMLLTGFFGNGCVNRTMKEVEALIDQRDAAPGMGEKV